MIEREMVLQAVQQFIRTGTVSLGEVKITRVPDQKTTFVEQIGDMGRSIMMNEYEVDGKSYWAGYSPRSRTVFISYGSSG